LLITFLAGQEAALPKLIGSVKGQPRGAPTDGKKKQPAKPSAG
jgi:hypothetical protein